MRFRNNAARGPVSQYDSHAHTAAVVWEDESCGRHANRRKTGRGSSQNTPTSSTALHASQAAGGIDGHEPEESCMSAVVVRVPCTPTGLGLWPTHKLPLKRTRSCQAQTAIQTIMSERRTRVHTNPNTRSQARKRAGVNDKAWPNVRRCMFLSVRRQVGTPHACWRG